MLDEVEKGVIILLVYLCLTPHCTVISMERRARFEIWLLGHCTVSSTY